MPAHAPTTTGGATSSDSAAEIYARIPEALQASLHHQQQLTQVVLEQQRRSALPPTKVPKFSGDIKRFRVFLDAFNSVVLSKTDDYRDRLHFLNSYLDVDQQRLISGCILMSDSKEGFESAKQILVKKYGCKYILERSYVDQLCKLSEVKIRGCRRVKGTECDLE